MDQRASSYGTGRGDRFGYRGGTVAQEETVERPANAYAGVQRNMAALGRDLLRLADLQLQLFSVDLAEFWGRARFGLVLMITGSIALLAALPVLIIAASHYLSAATDLTLPGAFLVLSLVTIVIAGLSLWGALRRLTTAAATLSRSREELKENLDWLRSSLDSRDD